MDKTTDTGRCRYCGQIIYLGRSIPEDQSEEAATLACNCKEGVYYRTRIKRIEQTDDNIDLAFIENHPEMAQLLKDAVPLLIDYKIAKISIDTGKNIKGTVSMTTKGNLKVEKQVSKKVTYDE